MVDAVDGAGVATSEDGDAAVAAPHRLMMSVFARGGINFSNARLAFYSIGESIDLALLDARVTALITAFAAAIP